MSHRIGLVGLGEAGNLGDDLILIAAVASIKQALPDAAVVHTGFGQRLDWRQMSRELSLELSPESRSGSRNLPFSRRDRRLLSDCDAVLFGGGGLLQTTHHPHRPYHWIRYLPAKRHIPVLAVGLGIGPLSDEWTSKLRALGMPFDACYLRDPDSIELAQSSLQWQVAPCSDFVDFNFLRRFIDQGGESTSADGDVLGVAVRAWPGLDPIRLACHVDAVANRHGVDEVAFFVLENQLGSGMDVVFAHQVQRNMKRRSTVEIYRPESILPFIRKMATCSVAISMKLHSSAVWSSVHVPMYPILYAPKTAEFFGRRFSGLEVVDSVVSPRTEWRGVPRAQDVVSTWLKQLEAGEVERRRAMLRDADVLRLQSRSLAWNLGRRLAQY